MHANLAFLCAGLRRRPGQHWAHSQAMNVLVHQGYLYKQGALDGLRLNHLYVLFDLLLRH